MIGAAIESMGAVLDTVPVGYVSQVVSLTATVNVSLGNVSKDQQADLSRVSNIDKRADILLNVSAFETAFGSGTRPKEGDTVTLHDRTWRVKPLNSSEPGWRYSDSYRKRLRIHLVEY